MILTVQTTEVTTCAGDGEAGGARVEMIERLLFDGINSQCTGFGIDFADEHTILIATAATDAGLAIGNATVMWTEPTLNGTILQRLIISTRVFFHLEHDCFIDIQFCVAPTIPANTGLILSAVGDEFFLGPVHFVGYLRQESTATEAFANIDAVTV